MHTILHLSDLHFGWKDQDLTEHAERKLCLDSLLDELKQLESPWRPTVLCLTGDIGWSGASSDYLAARGWLGLLLDACNLTADRLVICPGNHDLSRAVAQKIPRAAKSVEADEVLAPPIAEHFERSFEHYLQFCRDFKILAVKLGECDTFLVGVRSIEDLKFVILNTAWFSRDDADKEKLWIGLPHLRYIESKGQLPALESQPNSPTTIALLHHPKEWLHPDEYRRLEARPNTWDYLAARCHVILTGHTHGEVRKTDTISESAIHFTGGAAYAGTAYTNSVRLIQLHPDHLEYRFLQYSSGSFDNKWRHTEASQVSFPFLHNPPKDQISFPTPLGLDEFRTSLLSHAKRQLELKSRLLRPSGILPDTVQRPVSVRVSDQRNVYDPRGNFLRACNDEQAVPLYNAVRGARRTLLLGDLGMGKSTLAAQLVIDTINRSNAAVAILIPAKDLRFPSQITKRALLNCINEYVAEEIQLKKQQIDIASLLEQRIEVLLVFDGLDELTREVATKLLKQAAELVEHWPTIQVICTARPIELIGVSYAEWQVVHTRDLDYAAKSDFIRQELIADGIPQEQISEKTKILLRVLKEKSTLDSITRSPLAVRLIYPRLSHASAEDPVTLGDLLYDLLSELLEGWRKRDGKPSTFHHLEELLPTVDAKAEFLGSLAIRTAGGKQIRLDEARSLLLESAAVLSGANSHKLVDEVISFFEWLGFISIGQLIEFPLQPLAEMCAAEFLYLKWYQGQKDEIGPNENQWRIVSFVATLARRRGRLQEQSDRIASYIEKLLNVQGGIPAACYIVTEAADDVLAKITIQLIDGKKYRPLSLFLDEQKVSAQNIAKTLALAGEVGFEWLYGEYLDPRYPLPNSGSAIVREIFKEWALLVRSSLTIPQREKLSQLVAPYRATGEANFHGVLSILSILVPEAFTPEDRYWYQSLELDDRSFGTVVKQQFMQIKSDTESVGLLNRIMLQRSGESLSAAGLWFDMNPEIEPPYAVIRQAFKSAPKAIPDTEEFEIVNECRRRLGEERWRQFARWALAMEEATVSVGAASVLYDAGERRLSLLGNVALRAMHDGGYVAQAEKILAELIEQAGESGVRWLAKKVAYNDEWHGAHSGWWRVLLANIDKCVDAPELLAACAGSIGPYIIPRHPEVRAGFRRLVQGPKGSAFREAFRDQLRNVNPDNRRGAAIILATSDPQNEADALYCIIQSRSGQRYSDWHEWEDFCLTLNFGPSTLISLMGKLNQFDPDSRTLALLLLVSGGVDIESKYREELVITLSSITNMMLNHNPAGKQFLSTDSSFTILLELLRQPRTKLAQYAAEQLLAFHQARLTPDNEAICIAIKYDRSAWIWGLEEILKRIHLKPDFALRLLEAGKVISTGGGKTPLLCLMARAIVDKIGWKDIVWSLLCDESGPGGSIGIDECGIILLGFGLEAPEYQALLGQAAKECLDDPRLEHYRWADAYQWLAVIADEFAGLIPEEKRSSIIHGLPITYAAASALIARLGEVPSNFRCHRGNYPQKFQMSTGKMVRAGDPALIVQNLSEYARDSEALHPDLLDTIQECLFLPPLDAVTISSLKAAGYPGILSSLTLQYVYGQKPQLADAIPLLSNNASFWFFDQQDSKLQKLKAIWTMLRESVISEKGNLCKDYLAALDKELKDGGYWNLAIALEILAIRGFLMEEQIPVVFTDYSRHSTILHEILFTKLCQWLAGNIEGTVKDAVLSSTDHAVIVLNEAAWTPDQREHPNPWANLLFPVVRWVFSGQTSIASEEVFLRGIRSVFDKLPNTNDNPRTDITKLMAMLDPLLTKVPRDILSGVLYRGTESLEPSVSTFCRLIASLGKHIRN